MKTYGAYFLFFLVLWLTILAGSETISSPSYAAESRQNFSAPDTLNFLENEEIFIILEESGYQEMFLLRDSPWPPPDTTKHP